MRAAVYERYGSPDVVELKTVPKPQPSRDEVLIRTYATTVTSGDWRARTLNMPDGFGFMGRLFFGIQGPRQPILGSELAGQVESVGSTVTRFKVGDRVFAFSGASMGCHAEYKCMSENDAIALKPASLTYGQAAAMSFGGTTALSFFRRAKLKNGEKVLINGASGSVGTAAVQLAKHFGADVTAVCSASNVEMMKLLGADRVIDYTTADFAENGQKYDVIMDTAGTAPFGRCQASLTEGGRLLVVLGGLADLLRGPWVSMTTSKTIIGGPASGRAEDLRFLAELAESGAFSPVVGRTYAFEQISEAHAYVDSGRKRGNVVVTVSQEE